MKQSVLHALILETMLLLQLASSFSTPKKISPPPIIAVNSPTELQRAISFYIKPRDVVLELGAQLSDTSAHLCKTIGPNGRAVLVDVKRKEATSGRSKTRNVMPFIAIKDDSSEGQSHSPYKESFLDRVEYEELEQFDQWRRLTKGRSYEAMILDVGTMIGNDLHLCALSLAADFASNQDVPPRVIIIKSKTLSSLARRIVHSQRLLDGSIVLPDTLQRSTDPIFVPCVGVNEYRRTIPFLLEKGDSVIEVGCHFGRTTKLLHEAVTNAESSDDQGFCAGVDIGSKIIANAKKQYPHVVFEVVDAWHTLELLKVKAKHSTGGASSLGYDVVYADIGGLSGAYGLLESLALLDSIARALEPRCIVIKSLCMNRLASQLAAFSTVWNKIESPSKEKIEK